MIAQIEKKWDLHWQIWHVGEKLKVRVFAILDYACNWLNVTAAPLQFLDIPFDYLSILFYNVISTNSENGSDAQPII